MKQNKWKVIAPILAAALLAAAFWYGGDSPGSRGWTVPPAASQTADTSSVETKSESGSAEERSDNFAEKAPDMSQTETEVPKGSVPDQAVETKNSDKDNYNTDPVPDGKPEPVEPQEVRTGASELICTLSISCAAILDHKDWLDPEKAELVPEDGWLLEPVEVTFHEGESVFNILRRTCKQQKLHMEFRDTPMYNSAYIEGIGNLYEFDCGEQSGWMYAVNDWYPNYGCSRYQIKNGDVICWRYTCELGADIGGANAVDG